MLLSPTSTQYLVGTPCRFLASSYEGVYLAYTDFRVPEKTQKVAKYLLFNRFHCGEQQHIPYRLRTRNKHYKTVDADA